MSKYVKNLMTQDLAHRLDGVSDALLVNVVGMDAGQTVLLRRELRSKDIHLMVVKKSLAKRAAQGTSLAPAFENTKGPMDTKGSLALVWGGEDFVSLVKEVVQIEKKGAFKEFATRGGVMDGEPLTSDTVRQISKWPNREEQLSILLGQILSPGALLLSQLTAPGGALASQIEQKAGEDEPEPESTEPESTEPESTEPGPTENS